MRFKDWTFTYLFTYLLFYLGMYGYYRRVRVNGRKNIPKNKPLFFASNHQNSLVDPCSIAVTSGGKPVHFLTRSDVFKKKSVAKILYALNMLPIYRPRDGADFKEKNLKIFSECYDILNRKSRIVIFPEGSHDSRKHLRQIKSGVAKISIGAMEKHPGLDVCIVPVGLNYTNVVNKSSDLYVSYGKPIYLKDYAGDVDAISSIIDDLSQALSDEMIDFKQLEFYELYQYLFYDSGQIRKTNLHKEFRERKEKNIKFESWLAHNKDKAFAYIKDVKSIKEFCKSNKIKPYLFNKEKYNLLVSWSILFLGLPLFIYGWINNEAPYRIPRRVNKLLKDDQFHSSIYLIVGALLSGVFWSVQTILFYHFIDESLWWAYLVSLPVTGWLAFKYYIYLKKVIGKYRYNMLAKKKGELLNRVKKRHESIGKLLIIKKAHTCELS